MYRDGVVLLISVTNAGKYIILPYAIITFRPGSPMRIVIRSRKLYYRAIVCNIEEGRSTSIGILFDGGGGGVTEVTSRSR